MLSASDIQDMDFHISLIGSVEPLRDYDPNDVFPESDLHMSDSLRLTPSITLPLPEFNTLERLPSMLTSEKASENGFLYGEEFNLYSQTLVGYTNFEFDTTKDVMNPNEDLSEDKPSVFKSFDDIGNYPTLLMPSLGNETTTSITPFTPDTSIQTFVSPSPQTSDLTERLVVEQEETNSELSDSTESLSDLSMSFDNDSSELEELCAGTLRPLMIVKHKRQRHRQMSRRHRTTIPKKLKKVILHLYERYNTETGASIVNIAYTITEQYLKPIVQ